MATPCDVPLIKMNAGPPNQPESDLRVLKTEESQETGGGRSGQLVLQEAAPRDARPSVLPCGISWD